MFLVWASCSWTLPILFQVASHMFCRLTRRHSPFGKISTSSVPLSICTQMGRGWGRGLHNLLPNHLSNNSHRLPPLRLSFLRQRHKNNLEMDIHSSLIAIYPCSISLGVISQCRCRTLPAVLRSGNLRRTAFANRRRCTTTPKGNRSPAHIFH